MSTIKILPEILSNKIAAGEVVERPSAVVKELLENALDAESTRINVEVEKGGRSLIRIADNGIGMSHDDALLSLERYATSKISSDRDLFAITTLGFRGEALPSIASVSRFSLISRDEASSSGTQILVEGGKIIKVTEVGAPVGTMITVKNLFYNTPARRKFLKTVNTEMGHITDTISSMALSNHGIRLKLTHNGKTIYNWSPSSDHFNRILEVLGIKDSSELCPLTYHSDDIKVSGWAASDRHTRSTNRGIYIFVNNRFVRDKVITHALFEGFSGRLMKGQYPVAVIFIELPADQVDVNVHPTKHEIRFMNQKQVHDAVSRAVSEALKKTGGSIITTWVRPQTSPIKANKPQTLIATPKYGSSKPDEPFVEAKTGKTITRRTPSPSSLSTSFSDHLSSQIPAQLPERVADQKTLWEKRFFRDLRFIGQFHNTYLLCESPEDGLILIDQHAAHERIMYEQIKSKWSNSGTPRQKLLIPETMDLSYRETTALTELIPELHRIGLEIEPFGGNTFAVKAVPTPLADMDVVPIIMEVVEKMIDMGFSTDMENAMDECLKIMACHGSIRAKQSLSERQVVKLLDQLDQCENPSNCPHGRPTWIRWTLTDLEKKFHRIV